MKSLIQPIGPVSFPEWKGERHYMIPFRQRDGLPVHLRHWQPTVDQMLVGVVSIADIYIMVDQSIVEAGRTQRRPGPHIDGNWIVETASHGGKHRPKHSDKLMGKWETGPTWGNTGDAFAPEAIILASSVSACDVFVGEYEGVIGQGGDCSAIDLNGLQRIRLEAYHAYAGNVTMVHESVPVAAACKRTLVRLNVPGWEP